VGNYSDISPDFKKPNRIDSEIGSHLIKLEGTPLAIKYFAKECGRLNHYGYWFYLGTLWVSYSGWSDLKLWKRLFRSPRPNRTTSLMKPSELEQFKTLPDHITAYRAHREGETDWVSYTIEPDIAVRFARERSVNHITEYELHKRDVVALFLRRGEQELIMLDPAKAMKIREIELKPFYGNP
jgi:hypothetical protein